MNLLMFAVRKFVNLQYISSTLATFSKRFQSIQRSSLFKSVKIALLKFGINTQFSLAFNISNIDYT